MNDTVEPILSTEDAFAALSSSSEAIDTPIEPVVGPSPLDSTGDSPEPVADQPGEAVISEHSHGLKYLEEEAIAALDVAEEISKRYWLGWNPKFNPRLPNWSR